MYLILLGAPGVGKGTQSKYLVEEKNFFQLSTGELLRAEVASKTELGIKIKEKMSKGVLISDDIVLDIIKEKLKKISSNVIFDGFPRTIFQAEKLSEVLSQMGKKINKVINIDLGDDVIEERLTARLLCKNCAKSYNKLFCKPKIEGVCDDCNGELYQRADDNLESIRKRLEVYHSTTKPLINYYDKSDIFVNLDGNKNSKELFNDIIEVLKEEI